MSDRIEKLAKEYAERVVPEKQDVHTTHEDCNAMARLLAHRAFLAGAAAGRAEAHTQRSPQVEGEA